MTASPLRFGTRAPESGRRHSRTHSARRRRRGRLPPPSELRAPERLELAGEDVALVTPCLFLFALARHDVLRRAGDEILVGESRGETLELPIEPAQLIAQTATLLLHVDRAFQG